MKPSICDWCTFEVADGSKYHSRCAPATYRSHREEITEEKAYPVGPRRRTYRFLRVTDPVTGSVRVSARDMSRGPDGRTTHLWQGRTGVR